MILRTENDYAVGAVVPALCVTIYFRGARLDYVEGVIACYDEFLDSHQVDLAFYADEDLGRFHQANSRRLRRPIERLSNTTKALTFFAWTAGGGGYESPTPVTFEALVRDGGKADLCYVRASFPIEDYVERIGADRFADLATRWASRLPLVHGYAGLALIQPPAAQARQLRSRAVFEYAERHPGFEVDDCGGTAIKALDRIKGVNWITFLDAGPMTRAGGPDRLRAILDPSIRIDPAGEGWAIRAGSQPEAGNLEAGDRLPLYGEVARALRSIRMTEHPALGPAEFGSFGPAGTARWLRRFDPD